jgi:hypothetical protein
LDIEEPVACRYSSAFDFHAALPGMLGATLIQDEVVQMREPREKRLLVAAWVVISMLYACEWQMPDVSGQK